MGQQKQIRSFDRSFEASRSDPRPTKTLKKTHKMVKRSKRLRLSRGKFHHTLKKPPKRRQSCTPSAYVFLRLINVLKKVRCVFFCLKRVLIKALHLFTLVRLDFRIQSEAAVNSPAFLIFKPCKAVVTAFEISGSFRIEQPIASR